MSRERLNAATAQPLSDLLGRENWSAELGVALVHQLARLVGQLHAGGRTHRAIQVEAVLVDEGGDLVLTAGPAQRRFGADHSDVEFCPPELAGRAAVDVPSEIAAAVSRFRQDGLTLDPRRIDVYQIGTLLCRLVTGQPAVQYLYSPLVAAKAPVPLRAIIDQALGYDPSRRLHDCVALMGLLRPLIGPPLLQDTVTLAPAATPVAASRWPSPNQESVGPLPVDRTPEQLGPYRIVARLGSGGMGQVYQGYDASLDRLVAIKVLRPELARQDSFVKRFRAEATAAGRVGHPNVVAVHLIGEDLGRHFFAMEYIEGESLAQRLARQRRIPWREAIEILRGCLDGLQAAHAQGLIHRDVKPGNILLEARTDRVVLVDFGLVRRLGDVPCLTAPGTVMGTVDYIAPEQARGIRVDGRADLYSLGVVFYEMLSGRLPFASSSPTSMIFQHAYESPASLFEVAPDVPVPVAQIVARLMAKAPAERYQDCAEVLADLHAVCEGREPSCAEPTAEAPAQPEDALPATVVGAKRLAAPDQLLALVSENTWGRGRDWLMARLRRWTPRLVGRLQGTVQLVDGAVEHCQQERDRVAALCEEARRHAAVAPEQQSVVEELDLACARLDATLARLRNQRDLLRARLRMAEARLAADRTTPRAKRLHWALLAGAAIITLVANAAIVWMIGSCWPQSAPSADTPVVENVEIPGVPSQAVTILTFDQATILRRDAGFLVHDLSPAGNHWTGSGPPPLADANPTRSLNLQGSSVQLPRPLVNGQAEFTIAAKVWLPEGAGLTRLYGEEAGSAGETGSEAIFRIDFSPQAGLEVYAFNASASDRWMRAVAPAGLVATGQWNFLAVRLANGAAGNGTLTVTVNQRTHRLALQAVDHPQARLARLGPANMRISELAIYRRALSDAEIDQLRTLSEKIRNRGYSGTN